MQRALLAIAITTVMQLVLVSARADENQARPRLENYANYNAFLAAMYEFKKQAELDKRFAESLVINIQLSDHDDTSGATISGMPVKSPELSIMDDIYVPPLVISGPEDLEAAINAAREFLHPVYTDKLRYNRTTAQSFPLKPLESVSLEQAAISDSFKLGFSPDPEQEIAEQVTVNTSDAKARDSDKQAGQMEDISLNVYRAPGVAFGGDLTLQPVVPNQVTITATYK